MTRGSQWIPCLTSLHLVHTLCPTQQRFRPQMLHPVMALIDVDTWCLHCAWSLYFCGIDTELHTVFIDAYSIDIDIFGGFFIENACEKMKLEK